MQTNRRGSLTNHSIKLAIKTIAVSFITTLAVTLWSSRNDPCWIIVSELRVPPKTSSRPLRRCQLYFNLIESPLHLILMIKLKVKTTKDFQIKPRVCSLYPQIGPRSPEFIQSYSSYRLRGASVPRKSRANLGQCQSIFSYLYELITNRIKTGILLYLSELRSRAGAIHSGTLLHCQYSLL